MLCGAARTGTASAPFFLAMAPGISIPCGLRLACESPDSRGRKDEAGMESVRRRLRHDELAFSSVCLRARSGLLRQRGAAMGFWVAGLVVLLVLFRVHMNDVLNIAL